jgi:uncharacterized protein involved in exopolysaccharide biosynthesis/Mrp family chromosome partitioning ATPase
MSVPASYSESANIAPNSGMGGGVSAAQPSITDRLSLRRLMHMLRRRLWTFIGTFAAIVALGVIVTLLQPKVYQADAMVLLRSSGEKLAQRVTDQSTVEKGASVDGDAAISTEIQVITSLDIARRIVDSLNLTQDSALLRRIAGTSAETFEAAKRTPEGRKELKDKIARFLRAGLSVSRVGTSYSVQLSYRHSDPEIAAMLANAYADDYVKSQVTDKRAVASEAAQFLAGKVAELRRQATSDFAAVQSYRVNNGLLSSSATALTEQDISVYNQQVATARADAAADAARLATAQAQLRGGSKGDDVGEALSSSVVSSLRIQRAQIAARVADLSTRYGPRHPELMRSREELESVDRQIQAEIDRVISNLEAKKAVSAQRLASLNETLQEARGTLAGNNSALVTLDDLQRRAQASQGLYESYLARYRELMAGSGTEQPEARVLSGAIAPSVPISPNLFLNLALAGLVGLVAGLVVAIWAESQYAGLTTAEDVENRVGLPFLGLIPDNASLQKHAETPLATIDEMPNSYLAECVRGIYAATQIPVAGRAKVLAISSAVAGEGKTALTAMLGHTASAMGARTAIVDCDVLLRGLSRLTERTSGEGLREVIAGQCPLDRALRVVDGNDHLVVLPISSRAREGERLTDNGGIQGIVAQLKERFDIVLLDCPPLLAIAEAREIAGLADGVILTVRWRKTADEAVRAAARLLPARLADYTGVVLSLVNLRKQSRYAGGETSGYTSAQQYLSAAA